MRKLFPTALMFLSSATFSGTAQFGNGEDFKETCTREENTLVCNTAVMGYAWGIATFAGKKGIEIEVCNRFGGSEEFVQYIAAEKARDEMSFEELMWQFMFEC